MSRGTTRAVRQGQSDVIFSSPVTALQPMTARRCICFPRRRAGASGRHCGLDRTAVLGHSRRNAPLGNHIPRHLLLRHHPRAGDADRQPPYRHQDQGTNGTGWLHVITAAAGDQTAKPLEEARHGMFSYFLMKGMEGDADANKDDKITAGELHAYVQRNVIQQSSGSQTPEIQGDADRVLVRFQ